MIQIILIALIIITLISWKIWRMRHAHKLWNEVLDAETDIFMAELEKSDSEQINA